MILLTKGEIWELVGELKTTYEEDLQIVAKAQLRKSIETIQEGLLIQFAVWTNAHNDKTFIIDIQAWDNFWQALLEETK